MRHTGHLIKAALGETIIDRSHGFPGPRKQKYLAAGHDHQGIIAMVCPKLAMKLPSDTVRSEEHTSELQSLMRISYAVFCLKKKQTKSSHSDQCTIQHHRRLQQNRNRQ